MDRPKILAEIEEKLGIETLCLFKESEKDKAIWVYDNRNTKKDGKSRYILNVDNNQVTIGITWPVSSSLKEKDNIIFDFNPLYDIINIILGDEVVTQDIMAAVWGIAVKKRKTRSKNKNIKDFTFGEYLVVVSSDYYVTVEIINKKS